VPGGPLSNNFHAHVLPGQFSCLPCLKILLQTQGPIPGLAVAGQGFDTGKESVLVGACQYSRFDALAARAGIAAFGFRGRRAAEFPSTGILGCNAASILIFGRHRQPHPGKIIQKIKDPSQRRSRPDGERQVGERQRRSMLVGDAAFRYLTQYRAHGFANDDVVDRATGEIDAGSLPQKFW
jgi:hypothetical protein